MEKTQVLFLLAYLCFNFSARSQDFEATFVKIADLPTDVSESSGIVLGKNGSIWTHDDSGYENELFEVDTFGNLIRILSISNAVNMDWEDLARDANGNIWINDAGNNGNGRRDLKLYKISNPDLHNQTSTTAEIVNFHFSDQTEFPPPISNHNFDIEAMAWHADSIFLFTKDRSSPFTGYTKMYSLPAIAGTFEAKLRGSFYVDSDAQRGRVTAADIDTNSGNLALLTRSQVLIFSNYPNTSFFEGQTRSYFFDRRTDQVEALAFISSNSLYMSDEGSPEHNVPGGLYRVTLEEPLSIKNDFQNNSSNFKCHILNDNLSIQNSGSEPYQLAIFESSGRLVYSGQNIGNSQIPLSKLSRGFYIARIQDAMGNFTAHKFIY